MVPALCPHHIYALLVIPSLWLSQCPRGDLTIERPLHPLRPA